MPVDVTAFEESSDSRRVVAYDGPVGQLVGVLVGPRPGEFCLRVRRSIGPDVYVPHHAVARVGDGFVLLQGTRREIDRMASTRAPTPIGRPGSTQTA